MTFTCPRCGQEMEYAPDGCRDWMCPRDALEYLEADAEKAERYRNEFDDDAIARAEPAASEGSAL